MSEKLPDSAEKVRAALSAAGLTLEVKVFPASTRTSLEAAAAIGCSVAAIAKSLIFRAAPTGRSILIVASGANRVDEKKVAALIGEKLERADADFVRAKSGFAIGGVPPLAHIEAPLTLLDEDLLSLSEIWAAAGTPNAVFRLTPADLQRLTGARFCDLKKT